MTTPTESPAPTSAEIEYATQWVTGAKTAREHVANSENPDPEVLARMDEIILALDTWLADPMAQRPF